MECTVSTRKKTTRKKRATRKSSTGGNSAGKTRAPAAKKSKKKVAAPRSRTGSAASARVVVKAKTRSSRKVNQLLRLTPAERERHLTTIEADETIALFERSYPSELVNFLLTVKSQACRRMFLQALRHRKKGFLDILTLYYYRDYLRDPLPLTVQAVPSREPMTNDYALLGVARDSTEAEILEAGKCLVKALREENFPRAERRQAGKNLVEMKEAFGRLRSPGKRQELASRLPSMNYLYPPRDRLWLSKLHRLQAEAK